MQIKNAKDIEFKVETREYHFEIKNLHEDEEFFFAEGFATKFDGIDSFNDRIIAGSYLDTIKNHPDGFPAFFMHKSHEMPVGKFFELKETTIGLFVKAKLPKSDHFVANRLLPQLRTGSVNALSIGFRPTKVSFEEIDGETIRILEGIELREISFVTLGLQADSGALITNVKKKYVKTNDELMINNMVEAKRKGTTDEIKKEIVEYYHEKGKKNPFDEGSVISTEELKNLSKSNRAYAIRELKLSARAANNLAGLMEAPSSDSVNSPKGGIDKTVNESKVEDIVLPPEQDGKNISNDTEESIKTAIGDLITELNQTQESYNGTGKIC